MAQQPFIIGISGGSGSGKTYLAHLLAKYLEAENCLFIQQDSYYRDQSLKFDHDGGAVNFDHPESLEFSLLAKHLELLKQGKSVDIPIYDFSTHKRLKEVHHECSRKIIIVDGILILSQPNVRQFFNESIFVETPEELRFNRRLERDVKERGRTQEGVTAQFNTQVKPMHDTFVDPSKEFATIVSCGKSQESCDQTLSTIKLLIKTYFSSLT